MDSEQHKFVLENRHRMTPRQMAKQLGVPRTAILELLGLKNPSVPAAPPLPDTQPNNRSRMVIDILRLFVAAIVLRALFLASLRQTPFWSPLSNALDDALYDQMAQVFASGDWLARIENGLYRMPIYSYLIAILYRIFGVSHGAVHIAQSIFGALTPPLLYLLTLHIRPFDRKAALIAGAIGCAYAPLIYFDGMLLAESPSIVLNTAALVILCGTIRNIRTGPILAAGFLLGVSTLLRPNTLLAVLGCAGFLYLSGGRKTTAIRTAALLLIATGLTIAPLAVRNMIVYRDFVPLSAISGPTLYLGNGPGANGRFTAKPIGTEGSLDRVMEGFISEAREKGGAERPSQVSSYWTNRTIEHILSDPPAWIGLLLTKVFLMLNAYELPDVLNMAFVGTFIPGLVIMPDPFGWLIVLAAGGIILAWRERSPATRDTLLLVLCFTVVNAMSVVLFLVSGRYRLPVAGLLIPFAGICVGEIHRLWRGRQLGRLATLSALCAASALVVFWPIERSNFATDYNALGYALKQRKEYTEAEKYYRKSIQIAPEYPSPYLNLGIMLNGLGREREAVELAEKYESLKSDLGLR